MKIFKQLNKKGYKHYYEGTVEELDSMDKDNQHLHSEIMQVIMWLYKKHGVWIDPTPSIIEHNYSSDTLEWVYKIFTLEVYLKRGKVWGETNKGLYVSSYYYNSPTEAYEAAIEYVLTNLI